MTPTPTPPRILSALHDYADDLAERSPDNPGVMICREAAAELRRVWSELEQVRAAYAEALDEQSRAEDTTGEETR